MKVHWDQKVKEILHAEDTYHSSGDNGTNRVVDAVDKAIRFSALLDDADHYVDLKDLARARAALLEAIKAYEEAFDKVRAWAPFEFEAPILTLEEDNGNDTSRGQGEAEETSDGSHDYP